MITIIEPGTKVRVRTAVAENDVEADVLCAKVYPGGYVTYRVGWMVGSEYVKEEFPECMIGESPEKRQVGYLERNHK